MPIEWPQYITALAAFCSLLLSIYNYMHQRKKEKPNLKIDLSIEKCDKIEGTDQYCDPIKKIDVPTRVFTILNRGERAIMLERFDLCIKNTEKIEVPQVAHGYYEKGMWCYSEDFLPLPHDLLPDRKYHLRIHEEDIAKALRERGYSTKVELIGQFIDQVGNTYKSPSYWLDLNEFYKETMDNAKR